MTKGPTENAKSWADQVETDDGNDGNHDKEGVTYDEANQLKIVKEYIVNAQGKKVLQTKTYKINRVSKTIAMRMKWKKFGDCLSDKENEGKTRVEDEISINYNISDLTVVDEDEEMRSKLKGKTVTCRICKGDHWSLKCPYKDSLPLQDNATKKEDAPDAAAPSVAPPTTGKYVPPNQRDGGNRKGESMNSKNKDDSATIRVTNLSEDTREADLQDLFRPFGNIQRIFLAKDKATGQSKGYAFVSFYNREDAAKAIAGLTGYGYDHLILQLDWARPNNK